MKTRLIIAVLLCFIFQQYAPAQVSAEAGKPIFTARCTACHGIGKQLVGPDLKDVEKLRSEAWIIKFVHSSQTVIKSGDTAAVTLFGEFNKTIMPDHPDLSDEDIRKIIAYIKQESENTAKNTQTGSTLNMNKRPYPNSEDGFFHRVIFLDFPGDHMPLKPSDYSAWMTITIAVIFLVIALIAKVKLEDMKEDNQTKKTQD